MFKSESFAGFDLSRTPSPCYVVDEAKIVKNLKQLSSIQEKTGAGVLLSLKAFSMPSLSSLIDDHLCGVSASSSYEAALGRKLYDGEVHTYRAAVKAGEISELAALSDYLILNSFSQVNRHLDEIIKVKKAHPKFQLGLRVNPLHSECCTAIYDPCSSGSRFGATHYDFACGLPELVDGLHFHTLCEQGFEPLSRTLDAVEAQFGDYLHRLKWLNIGGGHLITQEGYNVEGLIEKINEIQLKYNLRIFMEPGEAVALNAGILVSEVLDIVHNGGVSNVILDSSAACHMPDVLEMPYRPNVYQAKKPGEGQFNYRFGGQTCLTGDIMGDYSFDQALSVGDRVMFDDMAHYTFVKNNTFNGIPLPSIATWNSETNEIIKVKKFSYDDFLRRLP